MTSWERWALCSWLLGSMPLLVSGIQGCTGTGERG